MSGLDLNVDTRRQIKAHQRIKRVLGRLDDVDEALVCTDLKLLAALFINVGSTKNRVAVDASR